MQSEPVLQSTDVEEMILGEEEPTELCMELQTVDVPESCSADVPPGEKPGKWLSRKCRTFNTMIAFKCSSMLVQHLLLCVYMTNVLCVTGSYQLLDEFKKYVDMDFPDIDLRTDSRLHVFGETLDSKATRLEDVNRKELVE